MKKTQKYCVYWITDAGLGDDWAVAYVGVTAFTPEKRLREHVHAAKTGSTTALAEWIREHLAAKKKIYAYPIVGCIADREEAYLAEGRIIHHFRTLGARILNSNGDTSKSKAISHQISCHTNANNH
jgi:hypothetical protein